MTRLLKSICFISCFLFFLSTFVLAEEITITTYYPSPYGSYNYLQVDKLGVGDNNGDAAFTSADVPTTSGNVWIKGNVGIGLTEPLTKLDILNPTGTTTLTGTTHMGLSLRHSVTTDYVGIDFSNNGRTATNPLARIGMITGATGSYLRFGTSYNWGMGVTSIGMTIDPFGNVGIGTTAPIRVLHVQGETSLTPAGGGAGIAYLNIHDAGANNPATLYIRGLTTAGTVQANTAVSIIGSLTKSSGSFLIDHPLDPASKVLRHSFVESPDMKNIYDGIATLDVNGEYVVKLPDYFTALNRDFRYQLTPIGVPAELYIKKEIENNEFVIAGGRPNMKVSWQVTGIRKDAYAVKYPIVVEEEKGWNSKTKKGEYLCSDCFVKTDAVSKEKKKKMAFFR